MNRDHAQNYFNLANAITGFAIVQSISFIIAFGTSTDFAGNVEKIDGWLAVLLGTSLAAVLYITAVYCCGCAELRLMPSEECKVRRLTKVTIAGRLGAIVAFSLFTLVMLIKITVHCAQPEECVTDCCPAHCAVSCPPSE